MAQSGLSSRVSDDTTKGSDATVSPRATEAAWHNIRALVRSSRGASEADIDAAHTRMKELSYWKRGGGADDVLAAGALYHHIMRLVGDALRTKRGKEVLLSFRGEQAGVIMVWIEKCISDPNPPRYIRDVSGDFCHMLRRLLIQFCKTTGALPPSLFLLGVRCPNASPIGCGGFADIYRAYYKEKDVALKRLRAFGPEGHQQSLRALCTEALVWQQLNHKHVLPLLGVDSVTFSPFHCMVSPWMKNGNIMEYINQRQGCHLPINRWIQQIAEGLEYLHSQKIVHGDLRGANILIDDEFAVRLSDFGLSIFADSSTASWSSIAGGATRWLAPEVIRGSRPTYKSDAYSFACACLEIQTRKYPFPNVAGVSVVAQILEGVRPTKPNFIKENQVGMWNIIEKCWLEDPQDRPDASFLVEALRVLSREEDAWISEYDIVFAPSNPRPPTSLSENESPPFHFGSPFLELSVSGSPASIISSTFEMVSWPGSSTHSSPDQPWIRPPGLSRPSRPSRLYCEPDLTQSSPNV